LFQEQAARVKEEEEQARLAAEEAERAKEKAEREAKRARLAGERKAAAAAAEEAKRLELEQARAAKQEEQERARLLEAEARAKAAEEEKARREEEERLSHARREALEWERKAKAATREAEAEKAAEAPSARLAALAATSTREEAEGFYKEGHRLHHERKYLEAAAALLKAAELDHPLLATCHCTRGACLAEMEGQEHWEAAVAAFTAALEQAPDMQVGWHNRGHVNLLLGRYRAAADDLSRALELMPSAESRALLEDAEAHLHHEDAAKAFKRAMVCFGEEQWEEARAAFEEALALGDHRLSRCHNGLGLCLSQAGDLCARQSLLLASIRPLMSCALGAQGGCAALLRVRHRGGPSERAGRAQPCPDAGAAGPN